MTTPTLISSSFDNCILDKVRRWGVDYSEALSLIEDSKLVDPPRKRQIRSNSPRGKLFQKLFAVGPLRMVPDPQDYGWFYKGGGRNNGDYIARLQADEAAAEIVLRRLLQLKAANLG